MATTVDPTTAIPKKVNVSIKDGQTISEEVLLLEIWSTGNVNGEKTIQVKDEGKSIKGTFRQIQLKFDINNNYIYTKNSDNQKLEKTYSGTASEFSISGLSTGNANTVIRTAKTSSISDLSKKYDGSAELVEVKVETMASLESDIATKDDDSSPGLQIDEYDDNKVRKLYLDTQEKRFEIPEKRHIKNRNYQTKRNKNGKEEVPTTEYDLLNDEDQHKGKSGPEFIDQEVTGYFKFIENDYTKREKNGRGTGLAIKLRGGLHPGDKEMKKDDIKKESGKCYEFHFEYYGNNDQCLQKEYPHNNYDKNPKDFDKKFELPPILGKWFGFKAVTINEDNGVRCEAYLDTDGLVDNSIPANNWKLWYSVLDDGSLFSKEDTREPFLEHHGKRRTFFRIDRVDHDPEHRFLSVRAISVEKTPYGKSL